MTCVMPASNRNQQLLPCMTGRQAGKHAQQLQQVQCTYAAMTCVVLASNCACSLAPARTANFTACCVWLWSHTHSRTPAKMFCCCCCCSCCCTALLSAAAAAAAAAALSVLLRLLGLSSSAAAASLGCALRPNALPLLLPATAVTLNPALSSDPSLSRYRVSPGSSCRQFEGIEHTTQRCIQGLMDAWIPWKPDCATAGYLSAASQEIVIYSTCVIGIAQSTVRYDGPAGIEVEHV
jgi:hypothetical protein